MTELRSRDECEQQRAVELAVGAIESLDSLIDQGHEVACEYVCQLLFDNLRQKVAERCNLPDKIVQHLLKDRCENIRLTVIKTNWESLTKVQQEEVIHNAELFFSKIKEMDREEKFEIEVKEKTGQMQSIIRPLLITALKERDTPNALRYIEILNPFCNKYMCDTYISKDDLISTLQDMPEVFYKY